MPLTKERIALLTVCLLAVVFAILWGVQYGKWKASESAANRFYLQIDSAKQEAEACARNYRAYTATPDQKLCREWTDRALICENQLPGLKAAVEQAQADLTTTTLRYAMDNGVTLLEQWNSYVDRGHLFSFLPKEAESFSVPATKDVIGKFPAVASPSGDPPVDFARLENGLFRLTVTADYMEAGETHIAWIRPANVSFVTIGHFSPSEEYSIQTSGGLKGALSPHFQKDECATSSSALVDGIDWNGKLAYRFDQPIKIRCYFIEMSGGNEVEFFTGLHKTQPDPSLNTLTFLLINGKKLTVQFHGSANPTFLLQ